MKAQIVCRGLKSFQTWRIRLFLVLVVLFAFSTSAYSKFTKTVVIEFFWENYDTSFNGLVVLDPFLKGTNLSGKWKMFFWDSGPAWLYQLCRYEEGHDRYGNKVFYIKGDDPVSSNGIKYKPINFMMYPNGTMYVLFPDGYQEGTWKEVPRVYWKEKFRKYGIKSYNEE